MDCPASFDGRQYQFRATSQKVGRSSKREFALFLCHARGSLLEVETQLEIARNLGYLPEDKFNEVLSESNRIGRMLNGLRSWCEAA